MKSLASVLAMLVLTCTASTASGQSCYRPYYPTYYPTYYNYVERIVPVYTPVALVFDNRLAYTYLGGLNVGLGPVQVQQQPLQQNVQPAMQQTIQQKGQFFTLSPEQMDQIADHIIKRIEQKSPKGSKLNLGPPDVPRGLEPISLIDQSEEETYYDIMVAECRKCHQEGRLAKGTDKILFARSGQLHPSWSASEVWDAVSNGRMPPAGFLKPSRKEALARAFQVQK